MDPIAIQPCLGFLPIDVIKRTLESTTQLAKWHNKVPLQKHWTPRFQFMNVHRLKEPVATDTFFANCRALGGATCAQVFYGIQSHMINVYPMKSESEGPEAYEDFIREEGCPSLLRRDNSKMQTGEDFKSINRHFCVKDGFTEPHHPHQNPAESQAVRWLKHHCQTVMNISGAPDYVWPDCLTWLADIHNVTANEALDYRTPYEKRHGSTPDISAYLLFTFWQPILYLDSEQSYPSSKELPGYFLGIAKHHGDALTFTILTCEGTRLVRSVIRPASGRPLAGFPNRRTTHMDLPTTQEPPYLTHEQDSSSSQQGGINDLAETETEVQTPLQIESLETIIAPTERQFPKESIEAEMATIPEEPVDEPKEGRPEVVEETQQKAKTPDPKPKSKLRFGQRTIPIERELSHSRPRRRKKKKVKHDPSKLRRSTRNSRLTRTQITSLATVLKAILMLGLLCFTTSPVQGEQTTEWLQSILEINPELEKEETDFDESYPESCDSEKARKLRYYHFVLDTMSDNEDQEDSYFAYNGT